MHETSETELSNRNDVMRLWRGYLFESCTGLMHRARKIVTMGVILTVCGCFPANADTNDNLIHAETLLETGKPDSAAVLLYDILDMIGDNDKESYIRTLYNLARAMNQLDRLSEEFNYLTMACNDSVKVEYADDVRYLFARTLFETERYDDSIAIVREFRDQFAESPLVPDMLFIAGNAYMLKRDYLRATNMFTEISRTFPNTEIAREAIMKEGVCLYNLDLINGAIERLELYVLQASQGENMADALFYLGSAYDKNNQREQAAAVFKRLVTEYPAHPEFMSISLHIGKLYYLMGKYAESENAFENFVFNAPPNDVRRDEALFYLERIKFRMGIYRSETEIAEHFITKYPTSPRAPELIFDLGKYYRTLNEPDKAVEKYKILLNNVHYSGYADSAAYLIADTYNDIGMKDEAAVFLIQTADYTDDPARKERLYIKLGALHHLWYHYDEAIGWYDKALSINAADSLSFRALCGIGKVFDDLNRWFEAIKTYQRIIEDYPENPDILDVRLTLANVYVQQGSIEDAIKETEKAVTIARGRRKAEILLTLAELYENYEEEHALKLYVLIYGNTENPVEFRTKALIKFGDLSLVRGDRKAALSAYNRILNGIADSVAVMEARERISRIIGKEEPPVTESKP